MNTLFFLCGAGVGALVTMCILLFVMATIRKPPVRHPDDGAALEALKQRNLLTIESNKTLEHIAQSLRQLSIRPD